MLVKICLRYIGHLAWCWVVVVCEMVKVRIRKMTLDSDMTSIALEPEESFSS